MPEYRRANIPGSSVFLTLITYQRDRLFLVPENIDKLRQACNLMMVEKPFIIDAAVILPEHIHCNGNIFTPAVTSLMDLEMGE